MCSLALIAAGSCERAAGSGGAKRPRSGAAGALDAAVRERIMGWRGQRERTAGVRRIPGLAYGLSCRGTGVTFLRGGTGAARGSQAYLGPRARAAPGDMMIDWVSSRLRGMRPLSLYRPSAWPCAAGPVAADSGLAGAGRGYAPSGEFGSGSPARPATPGWPPWIRGARAQAAVSASSPSSARMWQAWRRSLRASERAARLPSLRSLTAA